MCNATDTVMMLQMGVSDSTDKFTRAIEKMEKAVRNVVIAGIQTPELTSLRISDNKRLNDTCWKCGCG